MGQPVRFGNRAERRAQQQGKVPVQTRPRLDQLPLELAAVMAMAENCDTCGAIIRAAHGIEGFSHQQVHQAVELLRGMERQALEHAKQHPRFAEFYPDLAGPVPSTILGPSGELLPASNETQREAEGA